MKTQTKVKQQGRKKTRKIVRMEPPFNFHLHDDHDDDAPSEPPHSSSTSEQGSPSTPTPTFSQALHNVARLFHGRKRIAVIVGAGISVSCGIPDFRSANGLYNTLDIESLGLSCAEELFDLEFFRENPIPFYTFAKHLYFPLGMRTMVQPSDSHKLLALLEHKLKCLQRIYTQNIDGLEVMAGVSNKKMVYAHGSLQWADCQACSRKYVSKDFLSVIQKGQVPKCTFEKKAKKKKNRREKVDDQHDACQDDTSTTSRNSPTAAAADDAIEATGTPSTAATSAGNGVSLPKMARQREPSRRIRNRRQQIGTGVTDRSQGAAAQTNANATTSTRTRSRSRPQPQTEQQTNPNACGGILKPGVTFFGETLHDNVRKSLEIDHDKVDGVIVIGTSLSVAPISKVIEYFPNNIPRILINRTIVHPATSSTASPNGDTGRHGDGNGGGEDDKDFRDGYVFDAYLLGYCDDVTRALARVLLPEKANGTSKKRKHDNGDSDIAGVVLSTLLSEPTHSEDDDEQTKNLDSARYFDKEAWSGTTVPHERVLLFPGAQPQNPSSPAQQEDAATAAVPHFCEVAHCDGCSQRIVGTIQKCTVCFDFDLCSKCYPALRRKHGHTFRAERAG